MGVVPMGWGRSPPQPPSLPSSPQLPPPLQGRSGVVDPKGGRWGGRGRPRVTSPALNRDPPHYSGRGKGRGYANENGRACAVRSERSGTPCACAPTARFIGAALGGGGVDGTVTP